MLTSFGALSAEIPDGWTDDSTMVFSLPERSKDGHGKANITLTWEKASVTDPGEYLTARLRRLPKVLDRYKATSRGDHGSGAQSIPYVEHTFGKEVPMTQMVMAKLVGEQMVCITGTALTGAYGEVRERFIHIGRSVGPKR